MRMTRSSSLPWFFTSRAAGALPLLFAALAGLGIIAVVGMIDPRNAPWLPKCPLHEATGFFCAGCGSTRALHALLHGRLSEAIGYNALFVFAPMLLAVTYLLRRRLPHHLIASVAIGLIIAFGILRNVPVWPLTLLAPH